MNSISGCSFSAQPIPQGAVPLVGANGKSGAAAKRGSAAPPQRGAQARRRCLHRLGEVRRRKSSRIVGLPDAWASRLPR